jgi:uncharacterized membrane protein YjjP (DUF1212 family)
MPDDAALELLLRFAAVGHEAGYATADLEDRALRLGESLGLHDVQISVTPTVVTISTGPLTDQRTHTLRVRPASVDLGVITKLDDVITGVLDRKTTAAEALAALGAAKPIRRPWPVLVAAYSLAGAAVTPVLGGGWRETVAAAIVGLAIGGIAVLTSRSRRMEPIAAPLAAIAASFGAALLAEAGFEATPDVVTLAALVVFLPGMVLTVGIRELSTEQLASGVANIANALIQLVGLAFGVEIGRSVAADWFGPQAEIHPHTALAWTQVPGAIAAGIAFTVTLRARSRDAPLMCGATLLALLVNHAGASLLGRQAGVFAAALVVGVVGALVALRLRLSPLVFVVPGVLMLVPGSASFTTVLDLLTNKSVNGTHASLQALVTTLSIAYGLLIASMIVPIGGGGDRHPRRSSAA